MSFTKIEISQYPPRLWELASYAGGGKSTFATQMRGPLVVVDADQRFAEVAKLVKGGVFRVSDIGSENTDTDRIAARLNENMPSMQGGTIVIDSLTAIIAPLVTQAIQNKEHGREKNLFAGFRNKALAMRQLQDVVTKWGTDVLWIYHKIDARTAAGLAVTKASISQTELVRLMRSVNLRLEIVRDEQRRGIKVLWSRSGRDGMTLWDESGIWLGMPEKIEAAVYDELSPAQMKEKEYSAPEVFRSSEHALSWALERHAFENAVHAQNAYDKLKSEQQPKSAREMTALWIADVERRLAAQ